MCRSLPKSTMISVNPASILGQFADYHGENRVVDFEQMCISEESMGIHLITGANGGIGAATVAELTSRRQQILPITRADADLSLMRDVNRFADEIISSHDVLDSVILNAGMAPAGAAFTPEGFEQTFAVNHLGAFLLAHRLLPLLRRSEHPRIVITGSSDHMAVKQVNIAEIARDPNPTYTGSYAASKAVSMAVILEMAHRLQLSQGEEDSTFVRANVADPGWTRTGLTRNAPIPIRVLVRVARPLQNKAKHSARVLADLACEVEETGQYIGIKGNQTTSALLREESFRSDVYNDSAELLVESGFAPADLFLDR